MTYKVGELTFIKDRTHVDEAFVWASFDLDDETVACLSPGEPIIILSPIQVDPMSYTDNADFARTPTLYRVLTRGGVGWVSVFNILPCSRDEKVLRSAK
jgi:hypothetical protein